MLTSKRSLRIMSPGPPHAVCTPEDCLLVGGQFYTAGNLGRTLRMLRIQEQLKWWGIQFDAGAKKAELTTLLVRATGADNGDGGATERA